MDAGVAFRIKLLAPFIAVVMLLLPVAAQARPAYYGANDFYFWLSDSDALFQSVDLGSNVVRMGIDWNRFERGPGYARFSATQTPSGGSCAGWPPFPPMPTCAEFVQGLDDRVQQFSENGVTPLLSVGGTPSGWANADCPSDKACTPADPGNYGVFIQQLALRYALRGTPVYFEVLNEPDSSNFLYQFPNSPMPSYCAAGTVNRTACEYARMVTAARFVLNLDPRTTGTRLLAGALSTPAGNWPVGSQWLTDMVRNGAVAAATGVSYHDYPRAKVNSNGALLALNTLVNRIRPVLHLYGFDSKEVWITELARNAGQDEAENYYHDLLDEADDGDFYVKVLPALDRATYDVGGGNSIKALQGITPYQIHDLATCQKDPRHDSCSQGLYHSPPPILDIKQGGAVVKFLYHSAGPW
jgi:hypothetical protein